MATNLFPDGGGSGSGYDTADIPLFNKVGTSLSVNMELFQSTASITAGSGVWQSMIDVTGAGMLRGAALSAPDVSVGESVSLRITVDGTPYSSTVTMAFSGRGGIVFIPTALLGTTASPTLIPTGMFRFNTSLKIEAMRTSGSTSATVGWSHGLDRG